MLAGTFLGIAVNVEPSFGTHTTLILDVLLQDLPTLSDFT